jgi:hypothetical protein
VAIRTVRLDKETEATLRKIRKATGFSMETRGIFTIDGKDFSTYRIRRGHRLYPFEIFP